VPTTAASLAILAVERRTTQAEDMAEAGRHSRRFRFAWKWKTAVSTKQERVVNEDSPAMLARSFELGDRRIEVMLITDRWLPPDNPYFKVRDDGSV
jgi:hypothetical protein